MSKLTKNFSASEFADPVTGETQVKAELVMALQELRDKVGAPLAVTSGFRSGDKGQHGQGRAADIRLKDGSRLLDLYNLALTIPAFKGGGIGVYPPDNQNGAHGFIHVDVRPNGPARWSRVGGKYVGIDVGLKLLQEKKT